MVWLYNSKMPDGSRGYGGYAKAIRVDHRFVFPIPENLPTDLVAPLLCAGVTVFSPLHRFGYGKGHKIGVVGIGGLGHLGIKFAKALGCEVTAISSSPSKEKDCKDLGADHFLVSGTSVI
jgi:alcohol dehydrogenase (NADP+)